MDNICQEDIERAQETMKAMATQFQAAGHVGPGHGHSHGNKPCQGHGHPPNPVDMEKLMAMQKAMFAGYQDTTSEVLILLY